MRMINLLHTMEGLFTSILHTFRQSSTRMLAYVQHYKATDHSLCMADVRAGKIVELDGERRKEVVCITALDAGIGVMTSAGAQYFINRSPMLQDPDGK